MQYEVEQKYRVTDLTAIERRLAALAPPSPPPEEEVDLFFNHPGRDFAVTDEALRLRQKGGRGFITYKGPKIDATTKTRREIELPLGNAPATIAAWREMLDALGFTPVGEVRRVAARRGSSGKAGASRSRWTGSRCSARSSSWS